MSIILDKVNHEYSAGTAYQVQALKNVNIKIEDGEFIGIIGHTGSGKSTLARNLGKILGITPTYMDSLHWLPGWGESDDEHKINLLKVY